MGAEYSTILGVSRKASESEINQAKINLQLEFHPDRQAGQSIVVKTFSEILSKYINLASDNFFKPGESVISRNEGELFAFSKLVLLKESNQVDWEEIENVNSVPFISLVRFVDDISSTSEYLSNDVVKEEVLKFADFVLLKQSRFTTHFRNFFDSVVTDFELKLKRTPNSEEIMNNFNAWNSYKRFYKVSSSVIEKVSAYFRGVIPDRSK